MSDGKIDFKAVLTSTISWFVTFSCGLLSILVLISGAWALALFFLVACVFMCPINNKFYHRYILKNKAAIFVLILIAGFSAQFYASKLSVQNQKAERRDDFAERRDHIIEEMNSLINDGRYREAIVTGEQYSDISDYQFKQIIMNARSELEEKERAEALEKLKADYSSQRDQLIAQMDNANDIMEIKYALSRAKKFLAVADPDFMTSYNSVAEKKEALGKQDFLKNRKALLFSLNVSHQPKDLGSAINDAEQYLHLADDEFKKAYESAIERKASLEQEEQEKENAREERFDHIENWEVDWERSKMNDMLGMRAYKESDNTVKTWLKTVRPAFIMQCIENKTSVAILIDTSFAVTGKRNKARIRFRIDDHPPKTEYWSESTDGEAAFAPNAISLLRELSAAKTFTVEFIPHNANPVTAEFDIRGIDYHLEDLTKTCNWKL